MLEVAALLSLNLGVYPYKNRLLTTNDGKIETIRNRITPPFVDVHCIVLKSNFRFQVRPPAPNNPKVFLTEKWFGIAFKMPGS